MVHRQWFRSSAALTLMIFSGCNIFNPSGSGDAGNNSGANLDQGENYLRAEEYGAAMNAYAAAIRDDSTSSLAYYGYAKAVIRYYGINASTILDQVSTAQQDSMIPFLNTDDTTLTRYLQASSQVLWALNQLTARDTLTQWYDYLLDSNAADVQSDPLHGTRIAFILAYFQQAQDGAPGYRPRSAFPLSDRALDYQKIVADLSFVQLLYSIVRLRDLDQNDTIDSRDDLLKKLSFNIKDGLQVDSLQNIVDSLNTPQNRQNLNNLIQNVGSGLTSAGATLNLLTPILGNAATDTLSNQQLTGAVTQNIDSVVQSLGSAVTFYQFGDGIDNDGDGCIDEEIVDGQDNDGDGLIDEDARVLPIDGVDNDHNGKSDLADPGENVDSTTHLLGFVASAGFVQGPKYQDKAFRVHVQADSLTTRTSLTPAEKALLDSAKTQIGGCWNNYP